MFRKLDPSPSPIPLLSDDGTDDPLLDEIGPVDGAHVVVIGDGALPVLCGLIRRGAAAAAELQLSDRGIAEPAEIAVVPRLATRDSAARAIAVALRSLLPCGRIVVRAASGPGALVGEIAALLRTAGFSSIRTRPGEPGAIISADRPLFGPLSPATRA